jgi:exosortase K
LRGIFLSINFEFQSTFMKKYIALLPIALVVIGLKALYGGLDAENLRFLLWPLGKMLELFRVEKGLWQADVGWIFSGFVVDKSCAGFNFWLIASSAFCFTVVERSKTLWPIRGLGLALLSAYGLCLFANTARILGATLLLEMGTDLPFLAGDFAHQVEGTFVYFSLLVAGFYGFDRALRFCLVQI